MQKRTARLEGSYRHATEHSSIWDVTPYRLVDSHGRFEDTTTFRHVDTLYTRHGITSQKT